MGHTQHARRVLQDVEIVRAKLESEKGWVEWRLYWILAVVLVRAVGHVLAKVDGAESPHTLRMANELYRQWKVPGSQHAIFRDFIEEERNSIIKEYQFGMSEGPIPVVATLRNPQTGELVQQRALFDDNIYRPMWSGPYESEDGRTLLDDAIDWWREQLDRIDGEVELRLRVDQEPHQHGS